MSGTSTSRGQTSGVWVTAIGTTSVLGEGIDELRSGLSEGRSGLSSQPALPHGFAPLPFPACVGIVPVHLNPAPHRPPFPDTRQLRLAWNVVQQIANEVHSCLAHFGKDRVGLILGTSTGGILSTEEALLHYRAHGQLPANYSCLDGHAMDAVVRYLSLQLGICGPAFATSSACASGAKALASAKRLIELGIVDAVLAGGVDSIARMTIYGFHSLGVLSESNCSPFDDSSYGMNVAEGGAWLLLQRSETSPTCKPFASLVGVGESSDAHHMSAPDPSGASQGRAMRQALASAGLNIDAIAYINAHGTGTKANDTAEKAAILDLFGDRPASSTKGMLGHQLGAAGATEALVSIEVARELALCPSGAINAAHFPLQPQVHATASVLSNSFAFGGANIALAFSTNCHHSITLEASRGLRATIVAASALSLHPDYVSKSTQPGHSNLDSKTAGSAILGSRGRARASELTRLFAEGISWLDLQAAELSSTPIFVGSALGQIQTSKNLIELFLDQDASPLAFQGSVHNATAGVLSIALKNQQPSSSIAAGPDTLYATLLEAMSYLDPNSCPRVLVLIGDEKPPAVLGVPEFETAIAAFLLEHLDGSASVHPGHAILEMIPKGELSLDLTTVSAPTPLNTHICAEGLGLVDWLCNDANQGPARIHRPDNSSPWALRVAR